MVDQKELNMDKNIVLDVFDFEKTARSVWVMNNEAMINNGWDSWQELLSYMESIAYSMIHNTTSLSTAGFSLTAYDVSYDDGKGDYRYVRASISPFTAFTYLQKNMMFEIARSQTEIAS